MTNRPWFEIDVTDRWAETGNGWRAALPELAWIGGACEALRLRIGDDEVPQIQHDGAFLRVDGARPVVPGLRTIALLPVVEGAAPGLYHLVLGRLDVGFVADGESWRSLRPIYPGMLRLPSLMEGSPLVVLDGAEPMGRPLSHLGEWKGTTGWFHHEDGTLHLVHPARDPNDPERRLALALAVLAHADEPVVQWPAGGPFRRLGDGLPLPIFANIGVTNKCNLRCDICGTQQSLTRRGEPRRFMDMDILRRLAVTTFPFLREVELNSYGEPTLHPGFAEIIDHINHHRCRVKLQTNGTLLTPRVLQSLQNAAGTVWISVDAVGELFERLRSPGRWSEVDQGVRALLAARRYERLRVGLYPTVTRRSLPGVIDLMAWAEDIGIDAVRFHLYDPIFQGVDETPTPEEVESTIRRLRDWLRAHDGGPDVQFGLDWLRLSERSDEPDPYLKISHSGRHHSFPLPAGHAMAHPRHACQAPWQQLDFDLDGAFHVCCRSRTLPLGHADSFREFALAWGGLTLSAVRQSLLREQLRADILPGCADCVRMALGDGAVKRDRPRDGIRLFPPFSADGGHCHVVSLDGAVARDGDTPEEKARSEWMLYEDDLPLGPAHAAHEDIRTQGNGAYSHWGGQVYFSASDNSDPNINRRSYSLRRRPEVGNGLLDRLKDCFRTGNG